MAANNIFFSSTKENLKKKEEEAKKESMTRPRFERGNLSKSGILSEPKPDAITTRPPGLTLVNVLTGLALFN